MKKISVFIICVVTVLSSCKKEGAPAFNKSADERINETLTSYQNQLTSAENGWKAFIYPKGGGTYFFYFKFNSQNRVKMYSTFDSASAVTALESSYRLKALQQASLIFDTYSYVHVLADPNENVGVNANVNGGPVGVGLKSDFEFYFDSASADTIKLTGRFNGSTAVLTRATAAEATAYDNKELGRGFLFQNIGKYLNYFKRVTIAGVTYEINVNQNSRSITLSWLDGGNIKTFTTAFYYSGTGIQFVTPFNNSTQIITGFTNLTWNAATLTLTFNVNGAQVTVVGLGQPLKVDLGSPQRWWNYAKASIYLSSELGFHIDGIDDALGLRSLAGYRRLDYYPSASGIYDYARIVGSTSYGPGVVPTFTTDGRVTFTAPVVFGTVPAASTTTYNNLRNQLIAPSGYYLVQIVDDPITPANNIFDMVSASDGKAWVRWHY